jgi:hypothetical protein
LDGTPDPDYSTIYILINYEIAQPQDSLVRLVFLPIFFVNTGDQRVLSINRRQLLTGVAVLLGEAHLPFTLAQQTKMSESSRGLEGVSDPPKRFLSPTFTPEFLSSNLITATVWHPYPKANDREAWQAIPHDIRDALIKRAEVTLGTEWPSLPATLVLEFKENGNRTHYERLYFARRQRLTNLVLAECVEGKGRFLHEIVDGVWFVCEEPFWGLPAHLGAQKAGVGLPDVNEPIIDLFAAETGVTLSYVYYLVGAELNQVSPLINPRIIAEAKRRILDPGLSRNDFSWMGLDGSGHRLNNWTPWINSSWLETNLILEQDPTRRLATTFKICKSLDRFLEDYSDDGGCEEGPEYWGASAAAYFDCLTALTSATGGKVNVLTDPFVRKMGHYITDVHIADHYYVNYGDAHAKGGHSPELLYRFGAAVADPALEAFGAFSAVDEGVKPSGQGRLAREIPDVLIVDKTRDAQKKTDALMREAWYPALGLMTTRQKEGTSDGFYLAVQVARNNRSHGHYDSGSFIIFHNGLPVFIDVGVEAYTAKTFSSERFNIWTMQSTYHNLPTVGGVMQRGGADKYRASDVRFTNSDTHTGLSMNLATAYPEEAGIHYWHRDIQLERDANQIRLTEDFHLQKKTSVVLSFITPRVPSLDSKRGITLSAPDNVAKDVSLKFDGSLVASSFEKIILTDGGLKENWGSLIYRVLLTSLTATDGGKWVMQVS